MRLTKIVDLSIASFLIISLLLVNTTFAEETIDDKVMAEFDIEFLNGNNLKIDVEIEVEQINVFDTIYTKNEIDDIAANNQQVLGAIKLRLRDTAKNSIKTAFKDAQVVALKQIPDYGSGLFHDEFSVNLTAAFFDINDTVNVYDFVNGVLDIGAVVTYEFNLTAEDGWNNTFIFILPDSTIPHKANTLDYNPIKNWVTWTLENWNGDIPSEIADLSTRFKNSTTHDVDAQDIQLAFQLDARDAETTNLKTIISAINLDIRNTSFLPNFVTELNFVPADGIRLFIENGLISWDYLYNLTIKTLKENIVTKIENSSLNQTLNMSFRWDSETTTNCSNPYNITYMDNQPPIKSELRKEDIELKICGVSTRAVFGLLNAGAVANISQEDINFGDKIDEIGYNYNITLFMPANIFLSGKNIYIGNNTTPISGELESNISKEYPGEKIDTIVDIEVSSTDLNLFSFLTGKTELTMNLYIEEERDYFVTSIPNEFSIPEKISIDYLNSDAFRLLIEEEIFNEDNLDDFLDNEKIEFEKMMKNIFKLSEFTINGRVKRDVFDGSISEWDGDTTDMGADTPVKVVSYAHSSYPVSFNLSFLPPNLEIVNQSFNLTGLQNQNVTYRMIFPHGITVVAEDSLNRVEIKDIDGRQYIEIKFDSTEAGAVDTIKFKLIPSAFFIIGIFMPCIASLIITIILILVIYFIRKKRKGTPIMKESEGFEGYENEDYYVPPPPSSK